MTSDSSTRLFGVPILRLELFVGRDRQILEVEKDLERHGRAALVGLGGVGKTRAAVEYAYLHQESYRVVWYLAAQSSEGLRAAWLELSQALGLTVEPDATAESVIIAVNAALEAGGPALLIFDNAPTPKSVAPYLTSAHGSHFLVTSRDTNWRFANDPFHAPMSLHGLPRADAITFLRRRTGRLEADAVTNKLAAALNDLPLALEQAAALIQMSRWSFAHYLEQFESAWAHALSATRPGGDYPDAVALAWEIGLSQIETENRAAAKLLNLLAHLSSDGVPRSLLAANFTHLPEDLSQTISDVSAFDRAISILEHHGMLQISVVPTTPREKMAGARGDQVLSMHRLTASVARDRLDEYNKRLWAGTAARLMAAAMSFDWSQPDTWLEAGKTLPQALAAAHYAQANGVPVEVTCGLLDQAGRYLNRMARYGQAKGLLDQALALSRRAYGDESPKVSAIANNLGRVLARLGDATRARQHFEWALAIDQNTYGESDPHVASILNNYAMALHAGGDFESAKGHLEAALVIFESHYGSSHPRVATLLNNLGYVHQSAGDDAAAVELYQRALGVAQDAVGPSHALVASILHNLGKSLRYLGRPEDAREHLERALVIDLAVYGDIHPEIARDYQALAQLMQQLGDLPAARDLVDRERKVRNTLEVQARACETLAVAQA